MSNINLSLLAAIVSASASDAGYGLFPHDDDLKALMNDGLAAVNESLGENGNVAAQVTDKGKQVHADAAQNGGQTTATDKPKEKQTFAVVARKRPEATRQSRAPTGSKYPFDDIPAPDAEGNVSGFYVPATEEMPEPWKSLSSAVSQYNRAHGKVIGKNKRGHDAYAYTVRFRVARDELDGKPAAFVYRDKDGSGEAETDAEQQEAENGSQG